MTPGHMTHRQNVPSGQRHALLACRNTVFEHCIVRNTGLANNDDECITRDHADENTPLPHLVNVLKQILDDLDAPTCLNIDVAIEQT